MSAPFNLAWVKVNIWVISFLVSCDMISRFLSSVRLNGRKSWNQRVIFSHAWKCRGRMIPLRPLRRPSRPSTNPHSPSFSGACWKASLPSPETRTSGLMKVSGSTGSKTGHFSECPFKPRFHCPRRACQAQRRSVAQLAHKLVIFQIVLLILAYIARDTHVRFNEGEWLIPQPLSRP